MQILSAFDTEKAKLSGCLADLCVELLDEH